MMRKQIGVLAIQGAVSEHVAAIAAVGGQAVLVKHRDDLEALEGLILPGGESTTMRRIMQRYHLFDPIKQFAQSGKAIFGTCAGLVLLANSIIGGEEGLGLLACQVQRNGFGRQKESFEMPLAMEILGEQPFPAIFIRAPFITACDSNVRVLAQIDEAIVAVQQQSILATAFHPELSQDLRLMDYFMQHCVA